MNRDEAKPLLVLSLLRDDFTQKNYDGMLLRFSSAFIFTIILFFLIKYTQSSIWIFVTVIFLSAIACLFLIRRLMPDWVRNNDIVGTCYFYSNKIEVKTKNKSDGLELAKTSVVNITSNFYRGLANGRYSSHNGILFISIIEEGYNSFKITTILSTKQEYELMIEALKAWYKTGVPINEDCTEEKLNALLLKTNYTYAERQAAKAELGIG